MKKLNTLTVVVVTILVSGIFTLLPAQEANAQYAVVLSKTKTLPSDGTNVTFTLHAKSDLILYGILVDNTPTKTKGDCTVTEPEPPVKCEESNYRLLAVTIGGSDFRPGGKPIIFAQENAVAVREMMGSSPGANFSDSEIPLAKGTKMVLTFDTDNGDNDVTLKVTVGFIGASGFLGGSKFY